LWDALPTGKRGLYADRADGERSFSAIRAGDAIMIRRSSGSKMKTIVNALERRFPGKTAQHQAAV
jgi:UDP-N-acetylmuramoyl-tripeptide--D-alanyl-D-alanine ligase